MQELLGARAQVLPGERVQGPGFGCVGISRFTGARGGCGFDRLMVPGGNIATKRLRADAFRPH